jgi:hypothetical protein
MLPFLENLHFPYFSKLMNGPIHHDLGWSTVPTNVPLDIPEFKGNSGEDSLDHVAMFHLLCLPNSLNNGSIRLHLFQQTLTKSVAEMVYRIGEFQVCDIW